MKHENRRNVIPFELFMAGVSAYGMTVAGLRIFLHTGMEMQRLFESFDRLVCLIFILAFIHHVIFEKDRLRYIFTWGILDLASAIPFLPVLRFIRILRLGRVVWLIRTPGALKKAIQRDPSSSLLYLLLLTLLLVYTGTCAGILAFESQDPDSMIKTGDEALWFGLVTVSTVGYGEIVPVTTGARICAAVLMFSGIGVFASLAGFLLEPLRRLATGGKQVTNADVAARLDELYEMIREQQSKDGGASAGESDLDQDQ
ncbi:MAG: potassium channel family protein [Phycisphaerales bacterium]|nr:potassium channel family protein [Phycisphaerales bacterium]